MVSVYFRIWGISAYCLTMANHMPNIEIQFGLVACSLVFSGIWWKVCGLSPRKADRNWIKANFMFDELRGNHLMNKLTVPETTLKKVFPLRKIHSKGLLEFTGFEYGVLINLTPKRITEEERDNHTKSVKSVVDGLHSGRVFKMIACSKRNPRKAIIEYLMTVANRKGSKERAEHLNGILSKIMGDQTTIMMYRYYAFIGLGKHETAQAAE